MGDDAAAEARVGLAGPVLGTLATLVPLGIWLATGNEFWQALAYVGFFLNLFNLLPVLPLDGGRAMAALSPWVWLVGYRGADRADDRLLQPDPAADPRCSAGFEIWQPLEGPQHARGARLPRGPARTRALVALVYLGLVVGLAHRRRPDLPAQGDQRRLIGISRQSRVRSPGR